MPNRITVPLAALNGVDYAILACKRPIYPYEKGQRVSDIPIGMYLDIVLQGYDMEKVAVRFDHDPLPKVSGEQLEAACANCQYVYVKLEDCGITHYKNGKGDMALSGVAVAAQVVTLNSNK